MGRVTLPIFCNSTEPAITDDKAVKCLGTPVFAQYLLGGLCENMLSVPPTWSHRGKLWAWWLLFTKNILICEWRTCTICVVIGRHNCELQHACTALICFPGSSSQSKHVELGMLHLPFEDKMQIYMHIAYKKLTISLKNTDTHIFFLCCMYRYYSGYWPFSICGFVNEITTVTC